MIFPVMFGYLKWKVVYWRNFVQISIDYILPNLKIIKSATVRSTAFFFSLLFLSFPRSQCSYLNIHMEVVLESPGWRRSTHAQALEQDHSFTNLSIPSFIDCTTSIWVFPHNKMYMFGGNETFFSKYLLFLVGWTCGNHRY